MHTRAKLESDEAKRLLNDAVAAHCQIVIEFESAPGRTVNGTLISVDKQSILVQVTGNPTFEWENLRESKCELRIYHDRRYTAPVRVLDVPKWGETQGITLSQPSAIAILDRRRFLRAKLAPSSKVELEWKCDGTERRQAVSLLNVSSDGMACRVEDSLVPGLKKKHRLRAKFALPGTNRQIELNARVTNFTPASVGTSIMGLQFLTSKDDSEAIRALRLAIEREETRSTDDEEVHA